MIKYTLVVEGMQCSMCESHVNNAVRKAFPVKKVQSSHSKGQTIVIAEEPLDEQQLRDAIDATGYTVGSIASEPYEKKGLFSSWRKWEKQEVRLPCRGSAVRAQPAAELFHATLQSDEAASAAAVPLLPPICQKRIVYHKE